MEIIDYTITQYHKDKGAWINLYSDRIIPRVV